MIWNIVTAIATLISMGAYIVTALYIRAELKALEKDRYINVTSELFSIWQNTDFMNAQLWLLHRFTETTWSDFVAVHRGDAGELAFHRVGSFYDRVGTLVRLGLVNEKEILSTVGGYAIAVWQKIGPLVQEARRIENSVLFDDFERLLPSCYECYVPSLGMASDVKPFSVEQPGWKGDPKSGTGSPFGALRPAQPRDPEIGKVDPARLKKMIDRREPVTVLDVRQPADHERDPATLPGAVRMAPDDVAARYAELPPDREVIAFCA